MTSVQAWALSSARELSKDSGLCVRHGQITDGSASFQRGVFMSLGGLLEGAGIQATREVSKSIQSIRLAWARGRCVFGPACPVHLWTLSVSHVCVWVVLGAVSFAGITHAPFAWHAFGSTFIKQRL